MAKAVVRKPEKRQKTDLRNEKIVVQYSRYNRYLEKKVSVLNAEGPPVPIPNTEVKLCSGDNTSREAVREDSPMLT